MDARPTIDDLLAHAPWVDRVARALVVDAAERDDVVQEAWLAALSAPPRRRDNLRGWLGTVVRNVVRQRGRGAGRRERREERAMPGAPEPAPSADALAAQAELSRRLVDAVLSLEEPYRETVLLRFFEGMSAADIARLRDVPESTVRNRLKRALDRLRATFEGDGDDDRRGVLALLPLAARTESTAVTAGVLTAGAVMTWKMVGTGAAAVALVTAGVFWSGSASPIDPPPAESATAAPAIAPSSASSGEARAATTKVAAEEERTRAETGRGDVVLAGRVREWEWPSRPIAGARLTVTVREDGAERALPSSWESAEDGSFRISTPHEHVRLTADADGFFGEHRFTRPRADLELRLRRSITFSGRVVRPGGAEPVPGVPLELLRTDGEERVFGAAMTDEDGAFRFNAPAGESAVLVARRPHHRPVEWWVKLLEDGAEPLEVWLEAGATVRGRAFDAVTGRGIANARVTIDNDPVTTSADDGAFSIGGLVGPGALDVTADGHTSTRRFYDVGELGEAATLDVPLVRASKVTGRVVADDGAALPAAAVIPEGISSVRASHLGLDLDESLLFSDRLDSTPQDDGTYRVEGLLPLSRPLHVSHPGFLESRRPLTIERPGTMLRADVTLRRGATLSGTLSVNGAPVDRAALEWRGPTTSGAGRVFQGKLPGGTVEAGPVTLIFRLRDPTLPPLPAALEVEAGDDVEREFAFDLPTVALGGVVLDEAGRPIAGQSVQIRPTRTAPRTLVDTDEDGRFHAETLGTPASTFVVSAHRSDDHVMLQDVAAGRIDLVLRFAPVHHAAVRVVDATTGAPVPDFGIAWRAPDGRWRSDRFRRPSPGDAGVFRFRPDADNIDVLVDAMALGYRLGRLERLATSPVADPTPHVIRLDRGTTLELLWRGDLDALPARSRCLLLLSEPDAENPPTVEFVDPIGTPSNRWGNWSLRFDDPSFRFHHEMSLRIPPTKKSTVRGLAPGRYVLTIWPDDVAFSPAVIEVPAQETYAVEVGFAPRPR